jgi:hypothetical protein
MRGETMSKQWLDEINGQSAQSIRESLQKRLIRAIREAGGKSFEVQSLKLQYRNLDTSIRLGLL